MNERNDPLNPRNILSTRRVASSKSRPRGGTYRVETMKVAVGFVDDVVVAEKEAVAVAMVEFYLPTRFDPRRFPSGQLVIPLLLNRALKWTRRWRTKREASDHWLLLGC